MNKVKINFILVLAVLLTACSDEKNTQSGVDVTEKNVIIKREVDVQAFSRGQKLYLLNCAACHGQNAEGVKDWRIPDDDGKYPAPPLDGTAHTWHHSTSALVNVIKSGTSKIGGNMPAWKDKLSDKEILDILVWVKAQWPDEIYTIWHKNFIQKKQ